MEHLCLLSDGTHKWVGVDGTPNLIHLMDYRAFHPVEISFERVEIDLGPAFKVAVYVEQGHKGNFGELLLKGIFK